MPTKDVKYLNYLSELYPTISTAATQIINMRAILNLPKGTEHFMSDLHGEYGAFSHVLRNGSGVVRRKIEEVFGDTLSTNEKKALATLIYYPEEKLTQIMREGTNTLEWYHATLLHMIQVCKVIASKYTRSKVRRALPSEYAYIIEELITDKTTFEEKEEYYRAIVDTILELERTDHFIVHMAKLIQNLTVDHLHIIGDIYDRGPAPHQIMDHLMKYHSLDIQWGNHDMLWMGAAAGNPACIATIIRLAIRHNQLSVVEDAYGINLLPLATFALETYPLEQLGTCYTVHTSSGFHYSDELYEAKMHKAITLIQFKLEGQLIKAHPEYKMDDRLLLDKINYEDGTVEIDGVNYKMSDTNFPTINPEDPYALTEAEQEVVNKLVLAFINSDKLQKHVDFLLKQGSLYKVYNGNLLYHGCMPMNEDGSFKEVTVYDRTCSGKELFDVLDKGVRIGFFSLNPELRKHGRDLMWYLWNGPGSPLFGRRKRTTFERYYIEDKATHTEAKNPYYTLIDHRETAEKILKEFGLGGEDSYIINGHVPVHQRTGESPIKAEGKALIIDGGFSEVYQQETGTAGYTLTSSSHRMTLASHEPFTSIEEAILNEHDIYSHRTIIKKFNHRKKVSDTDAGQKMLLEIEELKELIQAYRSGEIKEHGVKNN
ncbi:MAG: fructose-1,6-bisphosphatase [Schaedlerella sp.]|nr:fructose-1,6-bisphosphatase [Schaedlerella sp.]